MKTTKQGRGDGQSAASAPPTSLDSVVMTSAELAEADQARAWLVESILLKGQPAVIGGPAKCLKSSLAIDLAFSLASGTDFLEHFTVRRSVRVAVFAAQDGKAALAETAERIAISKGVKPKKADVLWCADLPRLGRKVDLAALHAFLKGRGVGVVVVDPLHLALGEGVGGVSTGSLFEVGPLLQKAAHACLTAGATPVFVHHTDEAASKDTYGGPSDLSHLADGAVSAFARQWLLVHRRKPYRRGSGAHALVLTAEGNSGHSGCWHADVREGISNENSAGRSWQVAVHKAKVLPEPRPFDYVDLRGI